MTKIEITEGAPLSYTAADGAVIVVSVAGPVEQVWTLTVNGERIATSTSETWIRYQARGHAESHDARGGKVPASAPEIDGYEAPAVDLDELRSALAAPAQVESPLPVAERCSSGLASGANLTMPTEPQARHLRAAQASYAKSIFRCKACNLIELQAMARRGWLTLDDPIRPSYGTLTAAGRRALARYEAKHGVRA